MLKFFLFAAIVATAFAHRLDPCTESPCRVGPSKLLDVEINVTVYEETTKMLIFIRSHGENNIQNGAMLNACYSESIQCPLDPGNHKILFPIDLNSINYKVKNYVSVYIMDQKGLRLYNQKLYLVDDPFADWNVFLEW